LIGVGFAQIVAFIKGETFMRLAGIVAVIMVAVPALAVGAEDKPLPGGISMISDEGAKACRFIDIVSASDSFVFKKAEKASRTALIKAFETAKIKGANSAVMSGVSSANKETTVVLTVYNCPGK
jgi:hypothetical protein